MIDENPYAPPKSSLEDFSQPEIMVEPTNMQRLVRFILYPFLLPTIATVIDLFIHYGIWFFYKKIGKFELEHFKYAYLLFFTLTIIQSILFSLFLEFYLFNNKNKKVYSLWGGFFIAFSLVLFIYLVILKGEIRSKDIIGFCAVIVSITYSSYLTTLILNKHISYYNKKNRSGSLKVTP